MGSETTTAPSGPTVAEILTCAFIGAVLISIIYNAFLPIIAFGLSAVAMAMLSVSESIKHFKRHNE